MNGSSSMRRAIVVFAAAGLMGLGIAVAQDATPAAPKKDAQARYEPPSGPGVGQEFLSKFSGEWTVERIFYPPSGGAPAKATGECTQKMVQDGRFLESDFTFHTADGKTSTG